MEGTLPSSSLTLTLSVYKCTTSAITLVFAIPLSITIWVLVDCFYPFYLHNQAAISITLLS